MPMFETPAISDLCVSLQPSGHELIGVKWVQPKHTLSAEGVCVQIKNGFQSIFFKSRACRSVCTLESRKKHRPSLFRDLANFLISEQKS